MPSTVFKEVNYPLSALIDSIELGEIGLPDIQRPFVWSNSKVRDLFDSMYRGFPVGYLLFWVNGSPQDEKKSIGMGVKQKPARLLIVDGQQRLTSLYAVLKGKTVYDSDYRERNIEIAFRPRDAAFEVADAAIRRDPEYIPDISSLWADGKSSWSLVNEFHTKLGEAGKELTPQEKDLIGENIDRLFDLQKYPFTAMEISAGVDDEEVAQVFVRINSAGTPLNQADFILTLMSVFWDEGRAQLEKFSRDSRRPSASGASPFNHFITPDPDQLLRVDIGLAFRRARLRHVYSILRGKDLDTELFSEKRRDEQFQILKSAQEQVLDLQNWHDFLKVLLRAGFKGAGMITSANTLFYTYAIYLIGKRDFEVDSYELRNVVARWFFMASLTGRYSGSPETIMERDLAQFRRMSKPSEFIAALDRIVESNLTNDYWEITLPENLNSSAARGPALFAYNAALNLLDADALFSKIKVSELLDPAVKAKKSAVERHHLFPKGYLAKISITETRLANQIANYAFVEWKDNIEISDKAPAQYLPKYLKRYNPSELERLYYWHALPEDWELMQYEEFLDERRRRIAKVVRDGFSTLSD